MTRHTLLAIAATLLLVGVSAGASTASTETCREACSSGRQNCMNARKPAHRSCRSGCRENVRDALAGARVICDEQELSKKTCRKLVLRTFHTAHKACRADCREESQQAKIICRTGRRACAATCSDPIDPVRRDACVDDFDGCREGLDTCVDVCRDEREAAIEACHEQVADLCDLDVLRECLRDARGGSRSCASDCHGDTTCAQDLRECIGDSVEEPDDGGAS